MKFSSFLLIYAIWELSKKKIERKQMNTLENNKTNIRPGVRVRKKRETSYA